MGAAFGVQDGVFGASCLEVSHDSRPFGDAHRAVYVRDLCNATFTEGSHDGFPLVGEVERYDGLLRLKGEVYGQFYPFLVEGYHLAVRIIYVA